MRPALMLPEMVLFGGALVTLLGGSFLPRTRQWLTRVVAALACLLAAGVAAVDLAAPDSLSFEGGFAVDTLTGGVRLTAVLGTLLVLGLAGDEITGSDRESEHYALLLLTTTGALVLAGANSLLVVVVGFLLVSVPVYGLVGLVRTRRGAEAALKTYLLGSLFGILLMLGVTVLSGVAGTTRYDQLPAALRAAPGSAVAAGVLLVVVGLMYEAGAVPAHFWVPDAAEGAGGSVAAFLTTVPKIGAVAAAYRLLTVLPDDLRWPILVGVIAVVTMTLGNLAAYGQSDSRRLLGWSTVSQVGYLLVPVAVAGRTPYALPSLMVYLAGYAATNLGAFAVTTAEPERREITAYAGLASARPWLAGSLVVALLGLVGTPPTVVFIGKLTTATAAWDAGQAWLTVAVVLNSVVSLFYYLRWLAAAFRPATAAHPWPAVQEARTRSWSTATAVVAALLAVGLGLGSGLVWQLFDGPLVR